MTRRGPASPARESTKRKGKWLLDVDRATSDRLRGIGRRDTAAELAVRRVAHGLGLRFRVQNRDLAGSPDLANRRGRWVVFVHGCYWHRHQGCKRTTTPTRNRDFWVAKFAANVARDARTEASLRDAGYTVITIWECEAENPTVVAERLARVVRAPTPPR